MTYSLRQKKSNRLKPTKKNKRTPNFDLLKLIGSKTNEVVEPEITTKETRKFSELPLSPSLLRNLNSIGFTQSTQIQNDTFESVAEGRDLLGIANTGTGKTGAFLIPLINQLLTGKNFQTLIVVPTRELAIQVQTEFKNLSSGLSLYSACFIGGTNVSTDIKMLKKQNDIIVGTPGRLMDLINRRVLSLKNFEVLVLDEFDRMLDMGFVNDVRKINNAMVNRKQGLLFSATEDRTQIALIAEFLKDPLKIKVSSGNTTSQQVNEEVIKVNGRDRTQLLLDLLLSKELKKVLVFAETKRQVDKIEKKLNKANIPAGLIHGNKSQNQRVRALENFKQDRIKVLVATDVAARGLDVSDISHVINFQQPLTKDSYIHRIGRTGRAGKFGKAITFIE